MQTVDGVIVPMCARLHKFYCHH